jgi:branched-subunit amino acid aminotransferase/4-amino-4-deoxychorismate lyase
MQNTPHLINVSAHAKRLQKQCDDILWEAGVNDPRLPAVITELQHYKALEAQGILYEPNF